MKEKELTSKELLVQKLGMEFDEVAPIFSEETLTSMPMSHVVGGAGATFGTCTFVGCNVNTSKCTYASGSDCKSKKECPTKTLGCGDGNNTHVLTCDGPSTKPTDKPTESPTVKPTAKPASLL
mgnify:FL=1